MLARTGIVLGALTPVGAADRDLCARLVAAARAASVRFHRAFDTAADPAQAFRDILVLGADQLLTSGGAQTALVGADLLADLVAGSARRIAIMPGGGVTEATAAEIRLHFSGQASGVPGQPLAARLSAIMAASRDVST